MNKEKTHFYLKTDADLFKASFAKLQFRSETETQSTEAILDDLSQKAALKARKVSKKIHAEVSTIMQQHDAILEHIAMEERGALTQTITESVKKRAAAQRGKWASLFAAGTLSYDDFDLTTGKITHEALDRFSSNEQLADFINQRTLSQKTLQKLHKTRLPQLNEENVTFDPTESIPDGEGHSVEAATKLDIPHEGKLPREVDPFSAVAEAMEVRSSITQDHIVIKLPKKPKPQIKPRVAPSINRMRNTSIAAVLLLGSLVQYKVMQQESTETQAQNIPEITVVAGRELRNMPISASEVTGTQSNEQLKELVNNDIVPRENSAHTAEDIRRFTPKPEVIYQGATHTASDISQEEINAPQLSTIDDVLLLAEPYNGQPKVKESNNFLSKFSKLRSFLAKT